MKTKICTKCKIEKSLDAFSSNKKHKDGKASSCKQCRNKYTLEHKKERKIYLKENREEIAIQQKKYHLEYKEEIAIKKKIFNLAHKKEINDYNKKYYLEHKEEIKIQHKNNKVKTNKRMRIRCKTDIRYKLRKNLGCRIHHAVKGETKSLSTMFLVGCEIDYLKYHLQSQFTKGMSWDNYGEWHIDHIRPCASFDLSKPEEQIKCFNYKNLQPLWAKDNLIKRDKWNNLSKVK